MLGSPFIFNPILWIIIAMISFFGSFIPKDQQTFIPAALYYAPISENRIETRNWAYDNVDDDIFVLKKHDKIGTDRYVFQATHADIPKNQWQDVVFTDEKGNQLKFYLVYDAQTGMASSLAAAYLYEHPYVCKTAYPDQTGWWETDPAEKHNVSLYLPREKRTGNEVTFTLITDEILFDSSATFTYYVSGDDGMPKPVDQVSIRFNTNRDTFTLLSETHSYTG